MSANQGNSQKGSFGGEGSRGGGGGGRGERNGFKNARILPENERTRALQATALDLIKNFLQSGEFRQVLAPMSREQRKVMHAEATRRGLLTRSQGKSPERYLTLTLRNNNLTRSGFTHTEAITPHIGTIERIDKFLSEHPIRQLDIEHFLTERQARLYLPKGGTSRMKNGIPPKACVAPPIKKCKNELPATKYREKVLQAIDKNNVVIISGGTGCGKTTQIPQFILENATDKKVPVRVIVTQPRRIAAISISERVAKERGERLGDTVGFQIKLESKQSEKTLLTYCTTGVLLRMLTADPVASGITHIIMDEIHEREIKTDYLLIALRECLHKRHDLKLILMSATIEGNMALFGKYFGKSKVETVKIESKLYDVKTFHLDQILAMCGYEPPESQRFFAPFSFNPDDWEEELIALRNQVALPPAPASMALAPPPQMMMMNPNMQNPQMWQMPVNGADQFNPQFHDQSNGQYYQNPNTSFNSDDSFVNITGEWVSGGYQTVNGDFIDGSTISQYMEAMAGPTECPMTIEFRPISPKSVYINGIRYSTNAEQPQHKILEQFEMRRAMPDEGVVLNVKHPVKPKLTIPIAPITPLTPEPIKTASSGKSGLGRLVLHDGFGFGEKHGSAELLEKKFREDMKSILGNRPVYYHPNINETVDATDFEKLRFAEQYQMFYGVNFKEALDYHLLDTVIKYLADSPIFGSILVFLPGYEDIQEMSRRIDSWKDQLSNIKNVVTIMLHSQMYSVDNSEVFKPVEQGTRKIILSTNIAEASITIEDVIFVVDTGRAKEKTYDHEAKLHNLSTVPISKSNAKQRAGRAGRVANGYCIRLYSEEEFENMPETSVAEMKRAAIYDVTLHAKLFAPNKMRVMEFLSLAPEPPSSEAILQSMQFLEQVGAFYSPRKFTNGYVDQDDDYLQWNDGNTDPDLTDLGRLMARLPLDPQLSRMLLFGLALKCLTPIINLIAMMSNRDPYLLTNQENREAQLRMKAATAENDFSDHLMSIRICTNYCSKMNYNAQMAFCREHFLNHSTMRMVSGTRRQLLTELIRVKLICISPDRELMTVLSDRHYNRNSDSWPVVQAAIAAGSYPSIGISSPDSRLKKVQTYHREPAGLHPSSMVKKQVMKMDRGTRNPRLEYVAFQELHLSPDLHLSIKMVTALPSITALLFTGPIRMSEQIVEEYSIINDPREARNAVRETESSEENAQFRIEENFEMDNWYAVKAEKKILSQLLRLRYKFMHFFLRGIFDPTKFGQDTPHVELKMLHVIREVLEAEHNRHSFARVTMPNMHLRDFPYYESPLVKQNKQAAEANATQHELRNMQATIKQLDDNRRQTAPPPVQLALAPAHRQNVPHISPRGYQQSQSFSLPPQPPPFEAAFNNSYNRQNTPNYVPLPPPLPPQLPLIMQQQTFPIHPQSFNELYSPRMNYQPMMYPPPQPQQLPPLMVPPQVNQRLHSAGVSQRGRAGFNGGRGGGHYHYGPRQHQ